MSVGCLILNILYTNSLIQRSIRESGFILSTFFLVPDSACLQPTSFCLQATLFLLQPTPNQWPNRAAGRRSQTTRGLSFATRFISRVTLKSTCGPSTTTTAPKSTCATSAARRSANRRTWRVTCARTAAKSRTSAATASAGSRRKSRCRHTCACTPARNLSRARCARSASASCAIWKPTFAPFTRSRSPTCANGAARPSRIRARWTRTCARTPARGRTSAMCAVALSATSLRLIRTNTCTPQGRT